MSNTPAPTTVVVGGQYGSEAKGHVSGILASELKLPSMRIGGPNAGHSVIDPRTGTKHALRHLPVAAITNPGLGLYIGPGSEIDLGVLYAECGELYSRSKAAVVNVHRSATVIEGRHIEQETGLQAKLGSTQKGIGAARAARIWRHARTVGDLDPGDLPSNVRATDAIPSSALIEGTQGYGLGFHTSNYPYATSGDCRSVDFYAQSGLPLRPWDTWVVYRTYPIRVAGNSGPMYEETSWEELGTMTDGYIQPEKTTVTQLVRRVGRWDPKLACEAWAANGGYAQPERTKAALMFVDYIDPAMAAATKAAQITAKAADWISRVEDECGFRFSILGTGPGTHIRVG